MANLGVYPFAVSSPATSTQIFRTLLADDDPTATADPTVGEYKYLSDNGVLALLGLYSDNPRLAAASQLETIALSEALMRVWTSDDLSVNGAQTSDALRKLAAQWRSDAAADVDGEQYFDVVERDCWDDRIELAPIWYGN